MSVAGNLISFAATTVGMIYPPSAPALAILVKLEPFLEAGLPLLKSAIQQGPAAFRAASTAAPDLFGHLTEYATILKGGVAPTEHELAAIAAGVAGIDPPGWAHEDTVRWWDRATGAS